MGGGGGVDGGRMIQLQVTGHQETIERIPSDTFDMLARF